MKVGEITMGNIDHELTALRRKLELIQDEMTHIRQLVAKLAEDTRDRDMSMAIALDKILERVIKD